MFSLLLRDSEDFLRSPTKNTTSVRSRLAVVGTVGLLSFFHFVFRLYSTLFSVDPFASFALKPLPPPHLAPSFVLSSTSCHHFVSSLRVLCPVRCLVSYYQCVSSCFASTSTRKIRPERTTCRHGMARKGKKVVVDCFGMATWLVQYI